MGWKDDPVVVTSAASKAAAWESDPVVSQDKKEPDAAPEKPATFLDKVVSDSLTGGRRLGPLAMLPAAFLSATKHLPEAQSELAYNVGGGATDIATKLGASPETAAKIGLANNVAVQMFPPLPIAGAKGAGVTVAPAMASGARRLMRSSIKANQVARESGAADKAISTMLEKGINATEGGLSGVRSRVATLENNIQSILEKSSAKIDPYAAADNIKVAIKDVGLNLERAENLADIEKVYNKFINHDAIKGMGDIPVSVANKMKQAFYKELKDKAFVPGADMTAAAKGQKAITSGLRQEIAAAEPAVVPSLAEQSELLNVLKVAGPQAAREGNKNIIGLGTLSPRLEQVAIWMVDRYPWFKSMLARGMYSGKERIPEAVVGTGLAAAQGSNQQRQ